MIRYVVFFSLGVILLFPEKRGFTEKVYRSHAENEIVTRDVIIINHLACSKMTSSYHYVSTIKL